MFVLYSLKSNPTMVLYKIGVDIALSNSFLLGNLLPRICQIRTCPAGSVA